MQYQQQGTVPTFAVGALGGQSPTPSYNTDGMSTPMATVSHTVYTTSRSNSNGSSSISGGSMTSFPEAPVTSEATHVNSVQSQSPTWSPTWMSSAAGYAAFISPQPILHLLSLTRVACPAQVS